MTLTEEVKATAPTLIYNLNIISHPLPGPRRAAVELQREDGGLEWRVEIEDGVVLAEKWELQKVLDEISRLLRVQRLTLNFRVQTYFQELRSTGTAHHFAFILNTSDYRILRMDEDHDRMYVGSKDHILSLDLHDINKEPHILHWPVSERRKMECLVSGKDAIEECANFIRLVEPWNRTHLYICGTGAYNPVCTFVNRGRKPQSALQVHSGQDEQTSMYLQMAQARGRASRAAEPSAVHDTLGLKEEIFHLEPGKVESGKGKCSYDPNVNSVSALISEYRHGLGHMRA
ncbi:hypothetical protein F7725_016558 [Dissostichus mawsoni]|uniref:Sema domain-containing protein n=1 Tax=Dissostichus mawsoni TaxID=36200 RepID=A0A7J5Z1Y7_DISMA|nr:hypothetical protein F7725_016558 [Dissostichus mawsoni]